METNLTCCFCSELNGSRNHDFGYLYPEISSRVVWRNKSFAVIPSIGQVTSGYLLLVPFRHVSSFGELHESQRKEAEEVVASLRDFLSLTFANPIVFEHGNPPGAKEGGCGILHAHLHLVPINKELRSLPSIGSIEWCQHPDAGYTNAVAKITSEDSGYLFYQNQLGENYISRVRNIPSQFLRQWVAEQLNVPNWNWRLAGYEPELVRTLELLKNCRTPRGLSEAGTTFGNGYE